MSTELIKIKDNIEGWQISSSGSAKLASLGQLTVVANAGVSVKDHVNFPHPLHWEVCSKLYLKFKVKLMVL